MDRNAWKHSRSLATGVTGVEAAKLASYPQSSRFAASARKRARRKSSSCVTLPRQS